MALTKFSTLLSSQRTNTHHHEPRCRGPLQGNLFRVQNAMHDVNSRARTPPRPSRRRPRGAPMPTRHGRLPGSSWLPFGAAEATDQPQWMSITLAHPRPSLRAIPRGWAVIVRMFATPMAQGAGRRCATRGQPTGMRAGRSSGTRNTCRPHQLSRQFSLRRLDHAAVGLLIGRAAQRASPGRHPQSR